MNHYEKPNAEVISFCPDEALMDQGIGGPSGVGTEQGGGVSPFALHDSRDNR